MFLKNFPRKNFHAGILSGFLIIAAASMSASCGNSEQRAGARENPSGNRSAAGNEAQRATENPISVATARAEAREVPSFIQATGSLIAQETSDVSSQTSGQVIATPVSVGALVRQGDVVARLDDRNARLQLRQAELGVTQAIAAVRQAEARLGLRPNGSFVASTIPEVQAANASLQQAQAELRQAEANEQRYRDLVTTGDTSLQNYESYRTLRDTARARVNAARQQQEAAVNAARQNNQAIQSAQAGVESQRAQVSVAQKAVADAVIRAPYAGFVSNRPVAVGEYVTPSAVIVTILRTNPLKLQLQVPEADAPFITQGMGVSLEVDAFRDRRFAGNVTAVNPAIDPVSRSATVEAEVPNNDNALRAGMFATARIAKQGGSRAVFVPRAAVLNDQNTQSYRVFVVQDGVAKLRVVQIAPQEENGMIQIISGVNADDIVATSNLNELYEGAKVSPQ
jgi:RND family efflux transporter MFP subunit